MKKAKELAKKHLPQLFMMDEVVALFLLIGGQTKMN